MAPARSTNRRNTPVSPVKPGGIKRTTRTTRSLRSESRDDGDTNEDLRSHRSASTEITENAAKSTRRRGKEREAGDLSIVEEAQTEIKHPFIPNNEEEKEEEGGGGGGAPEGGVEGMSIGSSFNATAQTTYSEIALQDLDHDAMMDAIVPLYRAADSLVTFLNVGASKAKVLRSDLQKADSRSLKRLQRFYDALRLQKGHFGDKNYIDLDIAIRGLLYVRYWHEVGEGAWRPDNILLLANTANLACDLLPHSRENVEASVTLELLWDTFPKNFLTDLSEATSELGGSTLVKETFDFALEARIQYAIYTLNQHQNSDPDELVAQVFYLGDDLRGFRVPGLALEDGTLPRQFERTMLEALNKIRAHFKNDEPDVDVQALNRDFPWSGFLELLNQWVNKRANELKDKIVAQGGPESIYLGLQDEIDRSRALSVADNEGPTTVDLTHTGLVSNGPTDLLPAAELTKKKPKRKSATHSDLMKMARKKGVVLRKAPKQTDQGGGLPSSNPPRSSATHETTQGSAETISDIAFHAPPSAQPDPSSPKISSLVRDFVNQTETDAIQRNKENNPPSTKRTFLDRQPNAVRETDSSDDDFDIDNRAVDIRSKRGVKPLQPSPRKRGRAINPETEEDDDGDQFNAIGDDDAQRSEYQSLSPAIAERATDVDPRASSFGRSSHAAHHRPRSATSRARSPHPRVSSPRAPSSPTQRELTNSQRFAVVNQQAKTTRARVVPKKIQRRTPWSADQVNRLIDLIGEYGCSWTLLKTMDESHPEGSVLDGRDQVALKDKARNIRFDFECNRVPLPANFKHVPLKATQRDFLNQNVDLIDKED